MWLQWSSGEIVDLAGAVWLGYTDKEYANRLGFTDKEYANRLWRVLTDYDYAYLPFLGLRVRSSCWASIRHTHWVSS